MIGLSHRNPLFSLFLFTLINILLLSVQVRNEDGRILLRSWSLALTSPVATISHFFADGVKGLISRYFFLVDAARENAELKEENQRLKLELYHAQELQRLFDRTRDFELIRDQYLFDWLPAAVIGGNAPFAANRLLINAGTEHGVGRDAAVFTADGIVGRVLTTSPYSSEVELI
ncbi:MAG TPA: rod shape-determining protein MreC, partial [Acidobacteriota bacterium]|nr:rod shape-determining protein MreC [Acidobacteriota bacterium]